MSGVFQVDREIFDNSIWNNVAEFRLFFYILGQAVWKEAGVNIGGILVGRGQYLRSYRNLREDLVYTENKAVKYYSISHIKKITDKLVADERLKKEETELGTLFTVVNYCIYQGFERFENDNREQSENGQRTEQEQNKNNKKKDKKDNNKDYISVYDFYLTLDLVKHRTYTNDMAKAIKKAVKDNKYEIEYCKTLLERHKQVVEKSKDMEYPIKKRGLAEFFGQKVFNATHLICSEYEEGGKYYEQYLKGDSNKNQRTGIPPSESVLGEREVPFM